MRILIIYHLWIFLLYKGLFLVGLEKLTLAVWNPGQEIS